MCLQESMCICGVTQLEYKVENTLDKTEITFLNEMYNSMSDKKLTYTRYWNLFSVDRIDIPKEYSDPQWLSITDKLVKRNPGCYGSLHYFLKYSQGSYSTLHIDSQKNANLTSVTLIDKSDDLIGGDILLKIKRFGLRKGIVTPTDEEIKQGRADAPALKGMLPIITIPQNVGESVWYLTRNAHGVTYVTKGYRIVLISWYKNENNQI